LVPAAAAAAPGPATLFFRTRPAPGVAPLALSRRLRGRDDGVVVWCSFCWCRNNRSRRAKHREHSGHSNGFSLVCDRSWRFRCSSRANERWHVPQMCGRGLSVFGGGKLVVGVLVLTMIVEALKSKIARQPKSRPTTRGMKRPAIACEERGRSRTGSGGGNASVWRTYRFRRLRARCRPRQRATTNWTWQRQARACCRRRLTQSSSWWRDFKGVSGGRATLCGENRGRELCELER
jgi:hypothetical protein